MLRQLQNEQKEWSDHNFPNRTNYHPLLGAIEELGELAHAHLKDEQKIRTNEDHFNNKVDAVADIIIYLCDYCTLNGIDIQGALEITWERVKQRDWIKYPKNGITK